MTENIELNEKQIIAYSLMANGKNVFITGPGGTGKTAVIKLFTRTYKSSRTIAITSTTGTSALLLNGTTFHSYLGIGYGTGSVVNLVKKINDISWLRKRWTEIDCLIIDEVSMLDPDLFDKLEEIARIIRKSTLPFGKIQLILSGDFCQLPCIGINKFCFEAKSWDKCINKTIYLTNIIRQEEILFQNLLNNIRIGNITKDVKNILNSRKKVILTNDFGIKPTKLYATNIDVDRINNLELDKLAKEGLNFFEYEMIIKVYKNVSNKALAIDKFKKYCTAPEILQLCVGAQVMLLKNLSLECGLANGSRGVVVKFLQDLPVVKFLNGEERIIDMNIWEIEENDKAILRASQIPLKIAYAYSIHKCCSGKTLIYTQDGIKRISKISEDLIGFDHLTRETKNIEYSVIGKTGYQIATQIYKGDIEETIKITSSYGYNIEGSYKHPILTFNGTEEVWKKLPDITIGDYIFLKKNTQNFGKKIKTKKLYNDYKIPNYVTPKLCYLLGMLLGNGYYSSNNYNNFFIQNNILFIEIFGFEYNSNDLEALREFFSWCGLKYNIINENIPWVILENTKECHIEFLKGYYDIKGVVNKVCINTHGSCHIIEDLQIMFLNLGIVSTIKNNNLYINEYNAYLFYKNIEFNNPTKKTKINKLYGSKSVYENFIPNENLYNLFIDKIVNIEKGKSQLYDLYVPYDNSFIGNGIVNHNSQGQSLDLAEIDLSNIFEYGQSYVALSRVKSLNGLSIININYDKICANPKAVEYYQNLL